MAIPWKDQYKHPNWQKRRLEALQAAGFECENCGDIDAQLHVHHKRYVKGRMIWEYAQDELIVLCAPCHEEAHRLKDELQDAMLGQDVYIEQVIGYVKGLQFRGAADGETIQITSAEFASGVADVFRIHENEVIQLAIDNDKRVTAAQLIRARAK